jgi:hypothetical protein
MNEQFQSDWMQISAALSDYHTEAPSLEREAVLVYVESKLSKLREAAFPRGTLFAVELMRHNHLEAEMNYCKIEIHLINC